MDLVKKKFEDYLGSLKDQTAAGILKAAVDALPEDKQREFIIANLPVNRKMTAEDIEQHSKDHPMVPLDQCSKCEGIEVHGSMKSLNDSINCTALICDECADSEETEYNRCANCDFDMGVDYEHCGAAEDGTCPECGTDVDEEFNNWWNNGGQEQAEEHYGEVTEDVLKQQPSYPNKENAFSEALYNMARKDNLHKHGEYEVKVCRTGYGFTTIEVTARSAQEAEEKALNEAGDHSYSEKSSEYTSDGVTKL